MFDSHAQAYACDATALPEDLPASTSCWPEVALRAIGEDGLRLVRCLKGVEGQSWKSGRLEHSRWWAEPPSANEWMAFARAAGQSAVGLALPEPQDLPYQAPAIRLQVLDQLSDTRTELLRMGGLLLVFSLVGFGTYVAHEVQQAHEARTQAAQALERLDQDAAPARAAQDRALRGRADLEAMTRVLQAVQPLEFVEHLARVLQRGVVIKELELQGLEVRLVLEPPPDLSRSGLIESLEAGGWLVGVAEQKDTPNRAWISLQARLKALHPPTQAKEDAGAKRSSTEGQGTQKPSAAPTIPPELLKGTP
ncbi:MAG TPA: hypothetical protein VK195_18850 [Burkholderiaceae bacterium]|nr:hypothetical protein [Burkholderiaceae bacterium]